MKKGSTILAWTTGHCLPLKWEASGMDALGPRGKIIYSGVVKDGVGESSVNDEFATDLIDNRAAGVGLVLQGRWELVRALKVASFADRFMKWHKKQGAPHLFSF